MSAYLRHDVEEREFESTRLTYTGCTPCLHWVALRDGGLEHLKIETSLINERFVSVMGECVIWTTQVCHHCLFIINQ